MLGREIAEAESVPNQFLSKILHDLRSKGLVKTTKGPGGGYELAHPAAEVKVMDVVESVDGPIDLGRVCILGLDTCSDEESCALHDAWKTFRRKFVERVSNLSLAAAAKMLAAKRRRNRG